MVLRAASALRSLALGGVLLAVALPAAAAPERYVIDPEHLTVGFLVHHLGYAKTLGFFREASGEFVFDAEAETLGEVRVVVETASVFTNHERRDGHLRSDEFLDVEDHPQMTFVASGGEKTGERRGKVTGELTLRGETRPLTLDVVWNKSGTYPFGHGLPTIGISARGALKRSDFGMTYGVANGFVGDEVELIIEFEANLR